MENALYYGDNLDILREYIKDDTIDLVYLDPPFKSNQSYNILFKERNGTSSPAQIKAFEDTWHWDRKAEETYREIVESLPRKVADLTKALRSFLGENDVMAYLVMMTIRLQELYRVLKPTGSIYLHCDPTASHYLKLVMDAVFGVKSFQNEIIWCYTAPTNTRTNFPKKHDILFRYTKTGVWTFNFRDISIPYSEETIARTFRGAGSTGLYLDKDPETKHRERLKAGGKIPEDWWIIPRLQGNARERLGYPTQKPEALLERIIKVSSKEGDIILDPFCGCGTTITVAEKLKRKWTGIDITHLAVSLMKHRIENTFSNEVKYQVIGEPVDLKGAEELAKEDPYQFQWWALGLVGARPGKSEEKKGADRGIDGCIYFHDEPKMIKTKAIILQVKCGHINRGMIDALKGVIEREEAQIGVFITLQEPTKPMQKEALSAGFYKSPSGKHYPKMQILKIEDLINGNKNIERPSKVAINDVTFKKAKRHIYKKAEQGTLL